MYDVHIADNEENNVDELITAQDQNARTKVTWRKNRQLMLQQINII